MFGLFKLQSDIIYFTPIRTMSHSKIIVINFVIILVVCAIVKPKFILSFLKNEIRCNRSFMTCSMSTNGPNIVGEVMMYKELPSLFLDFQLSIHHRNSHQYQSLANVSLDYCQFIKNPYQDPFASIIWGVLHIGNQLSIFESCPVAKVLYLLNIIDAFL